MYSHVFRIIVQQFEPSTFTLLEEIKCSNPKISSTWCLQTKWFWSWATKWSRSQKQKHTDIIVNQLLCDLMKNVFLIYYYVFSHMLSLKITSHVIWRFEEWARKSGCALAHTRCASSTGQILLLGSYVPKTFLNWNTNIANKNTFLIFL